ncbi:RNA-binding domain-containing protein [Pseudohyphozyma bogoriensis]|nr:RNA-binding domain-containing protein [Pseudohyphozyma bogoriensis]
MRKCGQVLRADVALTPIDGRSRGFGVVLFAKREDALGAIERYNGYTWQTRTLDVRLDTQDPTGVLAIAEANRQAQQQSQAQQFQQMGWAQGPPPPPMVVGGMMPMGMMPMGMPGPGFYPPPGPPLPQHPPAPLIPSQLSAMAKGPSSLGTSDSSASVGSKSPHLTPSSPPTTHSSVSGAATDDGDNEKDVASNGAEDSAVRVAAKQEGDEGSSMGLGVSTIGSATISAAASNGGLPRDGGSYGGMEREHERASHGQLPPGYPGNMGVPLGGPMGGFQGFGMAPPPQQPPYGDGRGGGSSFASYFSSPQRGGHSSSSVPPGYNNRHLFVGNLPFNYIAQGPDGRSRGFGSVLFGNSQDAERAVQMYNGYDYNGRALKVHFDKFSPTAGSSPSLYPMPPPPPSGMGYPQQPPYGMFDDGHRDYGAMYGGYPQHESFRIPSNAPEPRPSAASTSDAHDDDSGEPVSGTVPSTSSPSSSMKPHASPPGRIAMPPPYPFSGGPLSPMQGRLPPMTPSMPAFTLGAFPQTPPLYPQFFSPGLGPFSPIMGQSSFFGHAPSHYMNAAPGAPLHRDITPGAVAPGADTLSPASNHTEGEKTPPARALGGEPSYFPPVPVSTSTEAPGEPEVSSAERTPELSTKDKDVATGIAQLKLDSKGGDGKAGGTMSSPSLQAGWGGALGTGPVEGTRRRSFVPGASGAEERSLAFDVRRRFEGGESERRASFEDSVRTRPAFGSSIWATNGSAIE